METKKDIGNAPKSQNWKSGNRPKPQTVRRSSLAEQPLATDEKLRPVFAAYFNMARANLYSVLRYISVQCGLDVKQDEDSMHELAVAKFANNKRPEVRQKAFSLLMRHIPVLQQMTQANLTQGKPAKKDKPAIEKHIAVEQQDAQQILQDIIRVINFQRNRFTHADHYDTAEEQNKEIQREKALYRPFETAFKGSKREVKRIFCYTAKDMNFVDQEERMKQIEMLDDTGNVVIDEKGKIMYLFVEHADWYFRLYDTIEDPITKVPRPQSLTTAGLTFLLCKLLHKRYATQLVQQTGLLRTKEQNGSSPFQKKENEVIFNIFCAHRIRLPKGRVESTASDYSLGLDMLNELQKCPFELFETFSPNDRKLFQVERKDGKSLPEPDDDINLFRRQSDRFPQLALRFIDTMRGEEKPEDRVLNDIVFQVALGKFRHSFYKRASLDTKEMNRLRVLQKEINGFGPIEKVEELRKKKYADYIRPISDDPDHLYDADTADTKPYLTDHHASYAITGGRIGITWNDLVQKPNSEEKRRSIRLKWSDGEMEKLDNDNCFLPDLPTPTKNIAPRAWLSVHDLPALIFLHLLGGNPEEVIKETYLRLTQLLNDISKGVIMPQNSKEELEKLLSGEPYKLRIRDIPKKLVDYLKTNVPQTQATADTKFINWVNQQLDGNKKKGKLGIIMSLKNRIERFEQDLKAVGDKQNRIGRKGYVDVRPGSLARYIAKDIMAMTRPDKNRKNNGKPSGLDYGVLQSTIATFKSNGMTLETTQLGAMLKAAINVANHPFLYKVMNRQVKDTIDLYIKYQKEKLNFLMQMRKGEKGNYKDQWFLREAYRNHVAKTPDYVQGADGLAAHCLEILQLPNGLFTDAIHKQLTINEKTKDNNKLKEALSNKKEQGGVSHLIYTYFVNVLGDNCQPFYREMPRHYKLLDWTKFQQDKENPIPILPSLVPPELYFSDEQICAILRKGDAKEAPIYADINDISNRLQRKVGYKNILDKRNNLKSVPDYGQEGSAKDEEKDALYEKLWNMFRDMQRNEQIIRRYRNEDMLLFLMAKKILLSGGVVFKDSANVERGIDQFKLQDILPPAMEKREDNRSLLEMPVEFAITIGLNDEKGKPITDKDGKQIRRTIHQREIKLKNYGDFFSFLYDSRIGGLLSQLPIDTKHAIERTDLEDELDIYDRKRLKVFAVLQAIEHRIIREHPELADSNANGHGFFDSEGKPYRNSFSGLLTLCKQYLASEEKEKVLNDLGYSIVDIRNAFSHNRYTSSDNKKIDISKMTLPQVAELILQWLEGNK